MAVARCRRTTNRSMRRNSFVWSDASIIDEPQLTAVRKRRMPARRASATSAELPTKLRTRVAAMLFDQRTIGESSSRSERRSARPRTVRWLR